VGALIDEHLQEGGLALAAVHHELSVSAANGLERMELTVE
jgi:ABC-type transport system involved in cytochrome c biogenesis ATPase subunit